MNDRAKQILIILVAARAIPWIQKIFGVTLSLEDIGDLFVVAVSAWHAGAATICVIMKRYFPAIPTSDAEGSPDPKVLAPTSPNPPQSSTPNP
jgi:hypothetical protein